MNTQTWVLLCNNDRTEMGFTTLAAHAKKPHRATTGEQMMVVGEFEAVSMDDARKIYQRFFGFAR